LDPSSTRLRIGVDVGASLAKLAIRREGEALRLGLAPADALERVAGEVEALGPARVAVTGGGGARLAARLGVPTTAVGEFDAWGAGARALLDAQGRPADGPFLLASLGTGTSCVRVDDAAVTRVGGTALGGGTLVGLGAALTGRTRFEEIVALAAEGDRRRVDLLISDIYPDGLPGLPGSANAASFGRLARTAASGARGDPRDLAGALVGLVGENVALLCCALAAREGLRRIVYAGAALRGNAPLAQLLVLLTAALGREPLLLERGEHAGALGALLAAEASA
jgi:type II pantothenate kinase